VNKIVWIVVLTGLLAACKKDHDKNASASCRIIGMRDTINNAANELTYNGNGKLSNLVQGSLLTTYDYADNKVIITQTNGGALITRTTAILNNAGLAVNVYMETPQTGVAWRNMLHEYDGQQIVRSTETTADGHPAEITTYQWSNGNLISAITGSDTTTYGYYLDKPGQPGDYLSIGQMLQGYEQIRAKNLFKSIGDNTFSYGFGPDGKISSIRSVFGGAAIFDYVYQFKCN
jgi:hypothetical protein